MDDNPAADDQIDSTIIKLAEEYASCDRRSAEINDQRSTIRENAEKLGIPSKAFQHAVGMVKHMSTGERRDYQVGVNRVLKAISDRQNDLFPVEAEKIAKREQKAADLASKTPEAKDAASDANARSNPDAGGAKPRTGKPKPSATGKPTLTVVGKDAGEMMQPPGTSASPPPVPDEQAEGAAALDAAMPKTKESQSAKAARIAAQVEGGGTTH